MALYSGLGLALLLMGQTAGHKTALVMGVLLLVLGTQIKTEGWIWLGVGLGFLALEALRLRFGALWLAALMAVAAGLLWLTGITGLDLGFGGSGELSMARFEQGLWVTMPCAPITPG